MCLDGLILNLRKLSNHHFTYSSTMVQVPKMKYIIDTFKVLTLPFQLFILFYMNQMNNTTMWVYVALHGSYGIFWIMKSYWFGDESWNQPGSLSWGGYVAGGLLLFWSPGILISYNQVEAENWYLFLCITIFSFGVFFHFTSGLNNSLTCRYAENN
jgi:hypothetical protein